MNTDKLTMLCANKPLKIQNTRDVNALYIAADFDKASAIRLTDSVVPSDSFKSSFCFLKESNKAECVRNYSNP